MVENVYEVIVDCVRVCDYVVVWDYLVLYVEIDVIVFDIYVEFFE